MKKNNKGFTLVELIVVMCLMGIIMAAVMGLLSPTSHYYYKVQNTKDCEEVAVSVGKQINNELQYALAVNVICSDSATVTNPDSTKFTNCIIIDNKTGRSKSKKHAPGIVKKNANGSESVILGEDFYGENAYKITVGEYLCTTGNNYLMLDFDCSSMKYEGGSYVRDPDTKYNYSQSITFDNINKKATRGITNADSTISVSDTSKTDYIYIFYQPVS